MNRTWIVAGAVALGFGVAGAAGVRAQGEAIPWLHVRVEEPSRQSKVSVNLPLAVVEAAIKVAPEKIARDGRFQIAGGSNGLSVAEMRKVWAELKNAGDIDLVTVEDQEETVKVGRKGDLVQVRVSGKDGEEVRVDVPVGLVDAALSGEGDEIEVGALVRELRKRRGDIVQVSDKDSKVRVWIDESNTGNGGR
jgi:hypothetical protein